MSTVAHFMAGIMDRVRGRTRAPWTPPRPWVDLHTHVLPGVDDGAATLDDALAMIARAELLGVTHIVATPHYSDMYDPPWERIEAAFAALNETLAGRGSSITLLRGREVSFTDCHLSVVKQDARFQIEGGSRFVLFELSGSLNRTTLVQGFFELLLGGVRPVAAHPERNPFVQEHPGLMAELRSRGVLVQMDAGSVIGRHGSSARRTALRLLAADEVDLLSSDAHRVTQIDDYGHALQAIYRRHGAARLQKLLCDVPKAMLNL